MDINFSLTSCGFYEITGKIWYTQTGHRLKYGGMRTACWMTKTIHTHTNTHTQIKSMKYVMIFHGKKV